MISMDALAFKNKAKAYIDYREKRFKNTTSEKRRRRAIEKRRSRECHDLVREKQPLRESSKREAERKEERRRERESVCVCLRKIGRERERKTSN